MRQVSLIIVTLICAASIMLAQAKHIPNNFEMVDSLLVQCFSESLSKAELRNLPLAYAASNEEWVLRNACSIVRQRIGVSHTDSSKNNGTKATIALKKLGVSYHLYDVSNDSLVRQVFASVIIQAPEFGITTVEKTLWDTIAYSSTQYIEIPRYSFTTAAVPEKPKSLYQEVVEPLVILAALGTTILLLFSVRTE